MAKKHYIVRPKSAIQIEGEIKTPDDQVAHIITDIDLYTLCSSIVYQRFDCEELVQVEQEESEPVADALVGVDQAGTDAADSVPAETSPSVETQPVQVPPVESVKSESDTLDEIAKLITYYQSIGIREATAESLADAVYGDEDVPDRELLKTASGIKEWIGIHKDLVILPRIGKTRAEEIQQAIDKV